MKNLKKQSKKGFSLIELLLVLGIIAALAIVAFIIYPKVSAANKAQTEASNINTIKAAINSLYASAPDYSGLDTTTALNADVFPSTMVSSDGSSASNTFKGTVTVAASDDAPSGASNSSFTITYNGVPTTECVKIVSAVAGSFYEVTVGAGSSGSSSSGSTSGTVVKSSSTALDVSDLASACESGGDNNSISFVAL